MTKKYIINRIQLNVCIFIHIEIKKIYANNIVHLKMTTIFEEHILYKIETIK